MDRAAPFEPLPADRGALRRRAIRDGLITSGLLATAFTIVVVSYFGRSLGFDAFSYWSIDLDDLYGRTVANNFVLGAFRYAPPIAFLFAPLGWLPWRLFLWLWGALMVGTTLWLGGRWSLVLLALPPVALEVYHGNVHLLMAAAVALGFRHPWTWSFVLLTKVTPGVGVLWFAVRREWRSLAIAVGATVIVSVASAVVAPHYWREWVDSLISNLNEPQYYSVPPPALVRLPLAAILVVWGARTDRPWTVAVAATLGLPILWPHGLCLALAAIPFLRLGDQAARIPDWQSAARLRTYAACVGGAVTVALALAALAGGPLRYLLDEASRNLDPYGRRG
ncbi:MAG: glycosyltransferase family 87 protein [Candidatus Limnocylindrales bacterium]